MSPENYGSGGLDAKDATNAVAFSCAMVVGSDIYREDMNTLASVIKATTPLDSGL